MRRLKTISFALLFITAMSVGVALAISASFHFANASPSGLNLSVSFKETGLGNLGFSSVDIQVTADATANYQCFNNGNNEPSAVNKETVSGPVVGGGMFPVRNGQTTGTITVSLPGPGSFRCPSGQHLVLESGTFDNIRIEDLTASDGPIPTTPATVSVP